MGYLMKLTIKNSRIRGNNFKISTRDYVLFTMFSAPFIDLLNGLIGGIVPVGVLVRTAMIGINLYLCSKWVTKSTCLLFFVFIYVMGILSLRRCWFLLLTLLKMLVLE